MSQFRFVGTKLVKACKWITAMSATIAAIYGVVSQAYVLPFENAIITAGTCIASVAMIVVGAAKPEKKEDENM